MEQKSESVAVGPYLLRAGGEAGTLVEKRAGAGGEGVAALGAALSGTEPAPAEEAPALAAEVEAAAEATTKIERAAALCKGAAEGHALDPDQLALEVGTLLDCLERLDRKKEHRKALQLARSLATLLMLLKRWASLVQTLRTALRAGRALGDDSAVAWAEHELGTLRLAAGDVEGAERDLRRAREIRERIGDRRGLAATERNLGTLCDRLRSMLHDEELVRREARSERAPTRMLALAGALAIFFGGGVAAGALVGGASSGNATSAGEGTRAAATSVGTRAGDESTEPTSPEVTVTETETVPPPTETTAPSTDNPTETPPPPSREPSAPPPVANTGSPPPITVESEPLVK
jgi:hypothetical protein